MYFIWPKEHDSFLGIQFLLWAVSSLKNSGKTRLWHIHTVYLCFKALVTHLLLLNWINFYLFFAFRQLPHSVIVFSVEFLQKLDLESSSSSTTWQASLLCCQVWLSAASIFRWRVVTLDRDIKSLCCNYGQQSIS